MINKTYLSGVDVPFTFELMILLIKSCIKLYTLIVGADSQYSKGWYTFALVIALVKTGKGGKYFYFILKKQPHKKLKGKTSYIAWKVWEEAMMIYNMCSLLRLKDLPYNLITHHDLSIYGDSGKHVNSIVGMMQGEGYKAYIKPDAFVASGIANKYTK